jgi:hypothetical protein
VPGRLLCSVALSIPLAVAAAPVTAGASGLDTPELLVPERVAAAGELATPAEAEPAFLLALRPRREPDLTARPPGVLVALAKAQGGKGDKAHAKGDAPSMDFDLLGDAPKPAVVAEDPSLRRRRKMLEWHQGLGIGLFALQLTSTVTGQLNYNDKFGVSNTGRYKETHKIVTYANLTAFAVVGTLALLAPTEKNAPPRGFGRTTVHKIGMGLATLGMITQGVLGVQTARREGYLDQKKYGRAHLAVGYATLAAMSVAVGAIVF